MAERSLAVGDFGTKFLITMVRKGKPLSIADAVTKTLVFFPPTLPSFTRTAVFETDGTDGQISYVTEDGDITEAGRWRARPVVEGADFRRSGSDFYFDVRE